MGKGVFQQHDLPDAAVLFVLASAVFGFRSTGRVCFFSFPSGSPLFCVDLSSSSSPLSGNRVQTAVRGVEMAGGAGRGRVLDDSNDSPVLLSGGPLARPC